MNIDILSLNSILYPQMKALPDIFPRALVVDPIRIEAMIPGFVCSTSGENKLKANAFAELASSIRCLRDWIHDFLAEGRLLVVILRPYYFLQHSSHNDLTIGNYDWLWPGAGRDDNFHLFLGKAVKVELTKYGEDGPFEDYLTKANITSGDVMAKGDFQSLAVDQTRRSLAGVLLKTKGKIVFLPGSRGEKNRSLLRYCISQALDQENWPGANPTKEIYPTWLKQYTLPETQFLESVLAEKEDKICYLEEECERIYDKLSHLNQLRNALFGGNSINMSNAVASIIGQWGGEIYPYGQTVELVSGTKRAIILSAVCNKQAYLWWGKKLLRMLTPAHKGILLINAYRHADPSKRPHSFCSQHLINFATEKNIAIISLWEIFQAHVRGQKNILDQMWPTKGILSLQHQERYVSNPMPSTIE